LKKPRDAKYQDLYIGLVRVHVLHHAAQEPVFGKGMMEELGRHGYRLGPGMMYPLLHSMERRGWIKAWPAIGDRSRRKCYRATRAGRAALQDAVGRVRELLLEITEKDKPGT
jgi:PadR family transcriptional regulator, regulatory protein PadR